MSGGLYFRLSARAATMRAHLAFEVSLAAAAQRAGVSKDAARARPDPNQVRRQQAAQTVVQVRDEAIYLTATACGVSQRPIARVLGLTQKQISKRISAVVDRREDPRYDRALDEIELQIMEITTC